MSETGLGLHVPLFIYNKAETYINIKVSIINVEIISRLFEVEVSNAVISHVRTSESEGCAGNGRLHEFLGSFLGFGSPGQSSDGWV